MSDDCRHPPTTDVRREAERAPARAGRERGRRAPRRPVDARSRRWPSTGGGRWSCSGPAGASRRSTSSPRCCSAPQGAGPTVIVSPLLALMRNQIAAAERAGIRAVTINSTNIESWEPIHDADPGRRGRRPAGQPGAAQQPGLPRRGAAPARRDLRAAGRRRGALHLRLGPRLPARLPADPHPARRPARGHPGAGDHRHRERPGHRRRRRAARHERDVLVLRGSPGPGVAAARRGPAQDRPAAAGLAGRPPRRAARLRHRLLPDRRRDPGDRRLPAVARPRGRGLLRPDRDRPSGWRSRRTSSPAGSRRWSRPAPGMGFDATLGFVVNMGAPQSPVAYYQQVGRAGRGTDEAHGGAAARDRGPRHLGLLRLARLPPRGAGPRRPSRCSPTRAARSGLPALETRVELNRAGSRRCSRCSTSTAPYAATKGGWESTGQASAYDEDRYRRVARGPRARAAGDARLPRDRRVPDGVPARPARRPRARSLRPLRQLRRPRPLGGTVSAAAVAGGRGAAVPPGVAVEPRRMWPAALGNLGIDSRARSPRAPSRVVPSPG